MRVPSPAARTTTVRGVVGGTIFIASVVGEKRVVARLGFEPRQTDSKSVVLPLHNLATQKHYSTNHLPDAKKCGDEFLGGFALSRTEHAEGAEACHYLAQSTQRSRRHAIISHRVHRGRGGMPLSRTEGAEDAEVFHYLAQRAQRTRRHAIISHRGHRGRGGIPLSRTEGAEDAEACHYLAQRAQRTRRIPDICTAAACCV